MVNALVEIDNQTNHVLNLVKAKYALRDKSEAIRYVVSYYSDEQKEAEFRPEFIERVLKAQKGKFVPVESFAKRYGAN